MTRSGRVDEDEPGKEELSEDDDIVHDQVDEQPKPDPKQVQRMAALKKAQSSRMANADIKRKEKALSDYESLQRKDEISRKFDELQERLRNKTKPQPVTSKAEPKEDMDQDDEPAIAVKKPKKPAPKKKKQVPKKVVYVEESDSSSSEDEEPQQVIVKKKKKSSKSKKKVVYESESDDSSDDERGQTVRRTAAMYYKLMFN